MIDEPQALHMHAFQRHHISALHLLHKKAGAWGKLLSLDSLLQNEFIYRKISNGFLEPAVFLLELL